jgi:predicted ATPase
VNSEYIQTSTGLDKDPFQVKSGGLSLEPPMNLMESLLDLFRYLSDLDDKDVTAEIKKAKQLHNKLDVDKLNLRMSRFTKAYEEIFDKKLILDDSEEEVKFLKVVTNEMIPFSNLSSGEMQIVLRGGFLLQNLNVLSGSLVLIDEPELSLHPQWQQKIFNYYLNLFRSSQGQLSQIFMTTHSEYVVKSGLKNKDTLVIVLKSLENNLYIESDKDKPPKGFLLNILTNGEILFEIFSIYSLEYHQALFERFKTLYIRKEKDDNTSDYANKKYLDFIIPGTDIETKKS